VKAHIRLAIKAHLIRGALLLVFVAAVLLALFAASALGRPREAKSPTLTRPINGVIGGNGTDGANCYTITSGTDTVVSGTVPVTILPGIDHISLTPDPVAIQAAISAVETMDYERPN
jgi:hypothetical protein